MAASAMLGSVAPPPLFTRVADLRAAQLHSGTCPANSDQATSICGGEGGSDGAVACSGDEEDTEGTESGRVARRGKGDDPPPSGDGTGMTEAPAAGAEGGPRPDGPCKNGFKEYGNVYEKHEPTMFGDWSHMGRVTDF
ncbi:hypothetical protein, conserved [Babesia bigemina]|uniref:Succinate dehydrogenase assembly factor 4, mitochondrial n=1 Tax=Babesia bigemina TaxID=5866 RepID=A0A061D557_BABBI|nr:hypothetical protein, conserved [Babesia bigemina]CDR95796.1 hypothetical protein, conserved [Babesia bigemina]|eukprot:XP_012767982.1 hypothetical protein, conserved [Babesia bigemina]